MLDSRRLPSERELTADSGTMTLDQVKLAMSAAVNYHYAAYFGYDFRFVSLQLNRSVMAREFSITWNKLFYVAERLLQDSLADSCEWLLFLDSDAYLTKLLSLPAIIGDLAARYRIHENVGMIIAGEQPEENVYESHTGLYHVNSGAFLVQLNELSRGFFRRWLEGGLAAGPLKRRFPHEQGTLTEILVQELRSQSRRFWHAPTPAVAVVNMTELNSPEGHYVRHYWGTGQKQPTSFKGTIERFGIPVAQWTGLVRQIRSEKTYTWAPGRRSGSSAGWLRSLSVSRG